MTALYPGCALEASSVQYGMSVSHVIEALEIPCPELDEWTCCGASSAHAVDPRLGQALTLRNLWLAEQQGFTEILAPCAACYHRLRSANSSFKRDSQLLADCNTQTGLDYKGAVRVLNLLEFLTGNVGVDRIGAAVRRPLSDLRVVCYYGCLNTRLQGADLDDDREWPMSMDRIVEAIGAVALDWGCRTECCGGSLFLTAEQVAARLVVEILKEAIDREADCIAVACPMCHNNLDVKQAAYCKRFDLGRQVPIVFITQLLGQALGTPDAALGLSRNTIPLRASKRVVANDC